MGDAPGKPFKLPRMPQEMPVEGRGPQALLDALMDDTEPGDFRYARVEDTGDVNVAVENADLLVAIQLPPADETGPAQVKTVFMSRLPPELSIALLEEIANQIREVHGQRSSRN